MKKLFVCAAIAAALLSSSAFAASQSGGIELTSGVSRVSGDYGDGKSLTAAGYLTLSPETTVTASVLNAQAWQTSGTFLTAGIVQNVFDRFSVSAEFGASNDSAFLARNRSTVLGHYQLTEKRNVVASLGFDHVSMSGGVKSDALLVTGQWFVPTAPVSLQLDARFNNATPGDKRGNQFGATVTYGKAGQWTVAGHADAGTAGYEADVVVSPLVLYSSKHQSVTARYWVARDAGVQLALDNVSNDRYQRKELRTTFFYTF